MLKRINLMGVIIYDIITINEWSLIGGMEYVH